MWNFYKEIFATVQLVTVAAGWAIYQSTFERLAPTAVFVVTMQLGGLLGAVWAGRSKVART